MTLAEVEAKYPGQPCFAMSLHDAACVLRKGHTGPHYAEGTMWGSGEPCEELRDVIAAED